MGENVLVKRIACETIPGYEKKSDANVLELKVYYDLGGVNFATYQPKPRGYYVSVSPLNVHGNWVSYMGFSGTYKNLTQCARKGKKAEEAALKALPEWEDACVKHVLRENNLQIVEGSQWRVI